MIQIVPGDLDVAEERMDEAELLEAVRDERGEEFVQEHRQQILLDASRMGIV
ncbi:hypothetical protein [Salinarchaeum sp. Harcht-Bsk1]|uniref:hypothetical protein n=1 Tax=Salinarchaeum sp. Harcht-Bsk1 TaxID=1333523 RepID=UPI0016515A74|nr:hypothetical protein [Salinarchaeum sp. Harcht-Bsk1]